MLLLAVGAILGLALIGGLATLLPAGKAGPRVALSAGCVRYFLIPVEWICGENVYFIQQGRKEYAGKTKDMRMMPRARPVQSRQ